MALRLVLVVLVVGLGLELPGGSDLDRWSSLGRDWVKARGADLDQLCRRAESALMNAPEADSSPTVARAASSGTSADLIFEAVGESMAVDLASDLASLRARAIRPVGPSVDAEPDCVVIVEEASSTPVEGPASSAKPDRLASAVGLTRQAARAWVSLLQEPTDEGEAGR